MKKRDFEKLKKAKITELESELYNLVSSLRVKQIDLAAGKETNLRVARNIRKDIAKIKTLISEKQK